MRYDSFKHHLRSIRLQGYDYSCPGTYFVTICTKFREHLFGNIQDGRLELNDAGRMVTKWWLELNRKFPSVKTGEFITMPNHSHGIIWVVGADLRVCPESVCPEKKGLQLKSKK